MHRLCLPALLILILSLHTPLQAQPRLSAATKAQLDQDIQMIKTWVSLDKVIDAVRKQNELNIKLSAIKRMDKSWKQVMQQKGSPNNLMIRAFHHPAAQFLRKVSKKHKPRYTEMFLCDNKGANVAVTQFTSDYWQGDEDKWIKAFNNGKGKVFIGEPEFDKSTRSMSVQISVPVMDKDKAIGVLVVGIALKALERGKK